MKRTTTWTASDIQATRGEKLTIVARAVAGVPLLGIGLAHVFDPAAPMAPLVEAAGLPAAGILSPLAVAAEIIAGALLLIGFYARLGAFIAIPTMVVAVYAHLAIDVWPNEGASEPPILLPLAVIAAAAYVLWRGAGRWSLDRKMSDR